MNLNSITTKISLIFFIAIAILVALFIFYIDYEKKEQDSNIVNNHKNISNFLKQNRVPKFKAIETISNLNFKVSSNPFEVIPNSKTISMQRGFETLKLENKYYLHIITPSFRILFKDLNTYTKNKQYSYIIFPSVLMVLIFIYIWLIKSLRPLKELKTNIKRFSTGDLMIDCKSDKKDEIAQVANEFDSAAKKIKLLLESRQLFLRTIMHELKTPIAKGRIVSELIDDEKQKDRMITIFERLDYLINDFSKIEQLVRKNYKITKQAFFISSVLEDALSVLMLQAQNEQILISDYKDKKIDIDLDLMSMVFKNLIDNAIKYSQNRKVKIEILDKEILFISDGEALAKDLEEYFRPFHNDTNSKNHGMGLGLYIVKSILDLHEMKFEYFHNENNNIFKITF